MELTAIKKDVNHDHFWIEDGILYESYRTLRGLRYRQILEVVNMPDTLKCTDACIKYIELQFID